MDTPKIDVNFINPFIDGTIETLKVQCSIQTHAGKPYLKGPKSEFKVDITAVIGLTSTAFRGSVAICFPERVFLNIMEKLLGEKQTAITSELEDGASELMNIIFGQAKKVLNEKNYAIDRAIPTVVRGSDLTVRHFTPSPTIVIPFESDAGNFHIEIGIS